MKASKVNFLVGLKIHNYIAVALLMVSPFAIGQAPPAQPPAQVKVPTFTPVSPQSYSSVTDSVSLSEVGVVTSQDCKSEQDAWVQASLDDARYRNRQNNNNYFNTSAEFYYKYIQDLYLKGEGLPRYIVKDGGLSRDMLRKNLQYFEERSRQPLPQCTDINSCVQVKSLTSSKLEGCLWKVALSRKGERVPSPNGAAPMSPAAKAKLESQCAPDAVASANRELQEIDQRLAAFLESSAGKQTGTATPSLQVVMWGTREQARVMKRYCPKADAFQERIDVLMSSFRSAQQACQTIQSRPEVCVPAAPQELIASYEKAQREAAAATSRAAQSGSSASPSTPAPPPDRKPSSSDSMCGPSGRGVCTAR